MHILIKFLFVMGIIFIFYGILVGTLGSGTGFFMVWLGMGALFLLFALSIHLGIWAKIPIFLKRIMVTMAIIGFLIFLVIEVLVIHGFQQKVRSNLDVILVLGAQIYENGPSRALQYRLDRAISYLEENPETICIVTGGQGFNEPFAEAVCMADYMKKHGIDEKRILLEDQSKTTKENIKNSRKMIPEGASIGIVTNNFHVFRALQIAKDEGLKEACGISSSSTLLFLPNNMFREFFGELKHLLFLVFR